MLTVQLPRSPADQDYYWALNFLSLLRQEEWKKSKDKKGPPIIRSSRRTKIMCQRGNRAGIDLRNDLVISGSNALSDP